MEINKSFAVKVLLTLLLILCAGKLAFSAQFYDEALTDAFFAFALVSIVILQMRVRPSWFDALLLLTVTLVLAVTDFRVLHYPPRFVAWLSFLGLSSMLIMAVRSVWETDLSAFKMLLYAWVPALLFVASDYFASNMLDWTAAAHPKTYDLYLLSFDFSLRVPLAFIAGRMYSLYPWLHNAGLLAYVAMAVPITLVYAGRLVRFREKGLPSMLAFLITGPLGIVFYNLFPAGGPRNLLPRAFPFSALPIMDVPRIVLEPVAIEGARNAMPSLHMAWVLLAWWYSRGLSWFERAIVMLFVVLTVFSTMGTGEHWFVDLVVAFPFALLIQAICAYSLPWKNSRRMAAFFLGLFGTISWLILLRYGSKFFWTSPVVPWGFVIATIALVSIRQAKLDRAVDVIASEEGSVEDPACHPAPQARAVIAQ
jgi:hypothetical protein